MQCSSCTKFSMTTISDKQPLVPVDVKLPEVTHQLDSDDTAAAKPILDDIPPGRSVEHDWYEP
jgi:hypothetical protein